jgi:7-cyano-7-deazaguanine synthase in queuosine biosynthesis
MSDKKEIVILYSGGLDSFIMKKLAESKGYDVKLIHFDIGQGYSEKEDSAIKNSGFDVEVRKVDWLRPQQELSGKQENNSGNIFIPGRNMILSSLAASIELPDEVWMGGLKGEDHAGATDKNKTFIDKTNELWSYVYSPFDKVPKLVFPLVDQMWGKFEAVQWLYENGHATKEEILNTSSCLSDSKEKNCGHCVVCCRRKYIFKQLGFEEEYAQDPLTGESNLKMIIEMLKTPKDAKDEDVHYDVWRRREIVPGLYIEFGTEDHNELVKIMEEKLKAL